MNRPKLVTSWMTLQIHFSAPNKAMDHDLPWCASGM